MDCMSVRRQIHAYLDQELDLPSMMVIDRHLTSCPGCQAVLEQLSTLQSGLREHAVRHGAPRGLAERIRAQVGAACRGSGSGSSSARRSPPARS
jgi:predicted anti-sigma-YlaC factor YlaD